jgi:hypothetical protein
VRESRGWTEYLGATSRAPSAKESLGASLTSRWVTEIGRAAAAPLAIGDSVILVQAVDQTISAVSRADGERRWKNRLDGPGAASPLLAWSVVYAATGGPDGRVYALALTDGHEHWSRKMGPVAGPIATLEHRVFAVTEQGVVTALDSERGSVLWRTGLRGPARTGLTVVNGEIIVATDDSLFALSPDSGRHVRSVALPSTIAPPAVSGDTMVFVTPTGDALALTAHDFSKLWRVSLGAMWGNAALARDTLFAVSTAGILWRVALTDPSHPVRTDLGTPVRAGPMPISDGVMIGTVTGLVLRIAGDSVATWRDSIEGPIEQPPVVDGGSLIAVDGHGRIHLWK